MKCAWCLKPLRWWRREHKECSAKRLELKNLGEELLGIRLRMKEKDPDHYAAILERSGLTEEKVIADIDKMINPLKPKEK